MFGGMLSVNRVYILPCCGFDRPGGHFTRKAAEKLYASSDAIVIGSIAALVNARAGELKDFRSSPVICIDGCGMRCASKIADSRGAHTLHSIELGELSESELPDSDKVQTVVEQVRSRLGGLLEPTTPMGRVSALQEENGQFLVQKIDKFTLRVKEGLRYSDNDFWVSLEGDKVRIGATDLLQQSLSDIYYVELVEAGREVSLGDDIGVLESTKTMVEIISPVSGVIVERNDQLRERPELVNESPYD
ncbi:MAG: putative zinc-binding protein, partial [Candidatus Thorarchaeota archaeon]